MKIEHYPIINILATTLTQDKLNLIKIETIQDDFLLSIKFSDVFRYNGNLLLDVKQILDAHQIAFTPRDHIDTLTLSLGLQIKGPL